MTKDELKQKIRTDLSLANADLPDITAEIVVKRVDEYIESLEPDKEVIPREWGKEVDKALRNFDRGFDYLDVLGSAFKDLGLSYPASQTKFIRALVNGYEVEPEPKFYVLVPGRWAPDERQSFFAKRREFPGITCSPEPVAWNEYYEFTMKEIQHYKLEQFDRMEVKEDEK